MIEELLVQVVPPFADRVDSGRALTDEPAGQFRPEPVRGARAGRRRGVADEIAGRPPAPLDVVTVRKVRHPVHAECAISAVAPETRDLF